MLLDIKFSIKLMVRELSLDLGHMRLGYVVWSDDEAIVIGQVLVEIHKQLLVRRPSAARDDAVATANELLHFGEGLGLPGNGCHTVEARVATHGDVCQAVGLEQLSRGVILHEEMGHGIELFAEPLAERLEEKRLLIENQRDVKQWNAGLFQRPHIVEPKLILDEKSGHKVMVSNPFRPRAFSDGISRCRFQP